MLCSFFLNAREVYTASIKINFDKAIHIVLPYPVEQTSVGSEYIESSIVEEKNNIVKVIAMEENFEEETNLVIIDKSGQMYSYQIKYDTLSSSSPSAFYPAGNGKDDYHVVLNKSNKAFVIFPSEVVYFQQGNESSLSVKQSTAKNILEISTEQFGFEESNVFAVDNKGNEYNVIITYGVSQHYIYELDSNKNSAKIDDNNQYLQDLCKKTLEEKRVIYDLGVIKNKITLSINNIFVTEKYMIFILTLNNASTINYDTDFTKFFFMDKKVSKNELQQYIDTPPLFVDSKYTFTTINGNSTQTIPFVFNKFTIPDDKYFRIEIFEKNGGRHLYFNLKNKDIMSAISVK
ncbi:MAG: DUF4138 domain-containing protein [Paludibacteraceae bacterium]|nr:DUF4138 domain-containing protein [Paludibacteraceae bacterium]